MKMRMQKSKANFKTSRQRGGFSSIELIITATILSIVTALGVMGFTRAKASVRLAGAAREYASHIEKARIFSIRTHADDESERASIAIHEDRNGYDVTMDLDGDGDLDTKTFALPEGVTFDTVETIAFDWRGRTWNTVGGLTSGNAQVSIRLRNSVEAVSVDVTGSGDITIDSRVFDDAVPNVSLNVADLSAGATDSATPDPETSPETSPDPVDTGDTGTTPIETPGGDVIDVNPSPTDSPSADPTPTPTATPTPTPKATPAASPAATPVVEVCSITTDQAAVVLSSEGTATIKVSHSSSASLSISATSSKPSELQATGSQNIAAGGTATFTIKSKKSFGVYSVTLNANCGSKTVAVTVLPSLGL